MIRFIAEVISDGRITIPKKHRKQEGIQDGDYVEVNLTKKLDGQEA